ncbi:MAG: hypothetical protein QXP22_00510 [Candidatus Anstonellales archaeon]
MQKQELSNIRKAFENGDFRKLKKFHDDLVNEIMLNPDKSIVDFAVYIYALSKLLTKLRYQKEQGQKAMKIIESVLLKIENEGINEKNLRELEESIKNTELQDKRFILDMILKGRLKTAALLYAKGLSLSTASGITGIIKEEILSYAGKTMMFERIKDEVKVKKRLENARKLLGGG